MNYLILLPTVAAFLLGAGVVYQSMDDIKKLNNYAVLSTVLVSLTAAVTLVSMSGENVTLFRFNDLLKISFKIDGLSTVFGAMVSFLWPLAVIYATEYMKHEGKQK